MQKRVTYTIIAGSIGALIVAFIGFVYFTSYGGNQCTLSYVGTEANPQDLVPTGVCDCFCCHLFNAQGWESCGAAGFSLGLIAGAIFGVMIIQLIWMKKRDRSAE